AARGRNQVIVTLGDRGAVSSGRHGEFDQSPWPVAAVDATAAGDAFVAAFAVALGRGLSLAAALDWAAAAGALTCTRLGAQESLPTAAELADFTARGRGA
ncbi:MAG: PfkB family carbohydrate kinase, partial [Methanocella sp.]